MKQYEGNYEGDQTAAAHRELDNMQDRKRRELLEKKIVIALTGFILVFGIVSVFLIAKGVHLLYAAGHL